MYSRITLPGGNSWTAVFTFSGLSQAATGGRGLRIVEKLSRRWGTSTGDEGTTVWAEVPVRPLKAETEMTTVGVQVVTTDSG